MDSLPARSSVNELRPAFELANAPVGGGAGGRSRTRVRAVVTAEMQPLDAGVDDLAAFDLEGLDGQHAADVLVELRRVTGGLARWRPVWSTGCTVPGPGPRTATWLHGLRWPRSDNTSLEDARGGVRLARRLRSHSLPAAARVRHR